MKIVRFRVNQAIKYGVLEDEKVRVMLGTPYGYFRRPARPFRLKRIRTS